MTLNELKTEVCALGFESSVDSDPVFICAANRALAMICTELPTLKTLRAPACPYAPIYYLAQLHHAAGERIELTLSGKAYSFFVTGRGSFTEISDNGRTKTDFDTPFSEYRGIINGSVRLVLEGDGNYELLDLSVYDKLIGDGIDGIPTGRENRILPDELVDDFSEFAEKPRDGSGRLIAGARFDGREVILPTGYRGIVVLRYRSRPKKITRDTSVIDVNHTTAYLLPILTAYFVWIDEEPRLAESYLELYRRLVAVAKQSARVDSAEYTDALRWS